MPGTPRCTLRRQRTRPASGGTSSRLARSWRPVIVAARSRSTTRSMACQVRRDGIRWHNRKPCGAWSSSGLTRTPSIRTGRHRCTGRFATDAPPPSGPCSKSAQIVGQRTGADPRRCSLHAGRLAAEEAVRCMRGNNNRKSLASSESQAACDLAPASLPDAPTNSRRSPSAREHTAETAPLARESRCVIGPVGRPQCRSCARVDRRDDARFEQILQPIGCLMRGLCSVMAACQGDGRFGCEGPTNQGPEWPTCRRAAKGVTRPRGRFHGATVRCDADRVRGPTAHGDPRPRSSPGVAPVRRRRAAFRRSRAASSGSRRRGASPC